MRQAKRAGGRSLLAALFNRQPKEEPGSEFAQVIDQKSERKAQAQAAYDALSSLDPSGLERAELIESGVALSTVEKLYPGAFLAVLSALPPLMQQDLSRWRDLHKKQALARDVELGIATIAALSPELRAHWDAWQPQRSDSDEAKGFQDYLLQRMTGRQPLDWNDRAVARAFGNALYNAWWLMSIRSKLEPNEAETADSLMVWVGQNLIPDLNQRR